MRPLRAPATRRLAVAALAVLGLLLGAGCATAPGPIEAGRVAQVLDELHDAASKADGDRYFALFTPDAVFLGTDGTERWTFDEFRTYASARFGQGQGWTYRPVTRNVTVDRAGAVAWFDELLDNENYGRCRGSGVLVQWRGGWKIAQYNLTFVIPNEAAADVVEIVRQQAPPAPRARW